MNSPEHNDEFEPFISSKEAAALTHMNYKTLERKARYRQVPAARMGRHWVFRKSSLSAWADSVLASNVATKALGSRKP